MRLSQQKITQGFVLAGLVNLSVLIFSRFFTNSAIPATDPAVMSNFGLVMIVLWGLAYISLAKSYTKVNYLVAVFALEKLVYGIVWLKWIIEHDISAVYERDLFAGLFYSSYGLNDFLFFGFFLIVFIRGFKK
jgi:hypothetical protein